MVPRAPFKVSASELCERLCAAGVDVTRRTVEHELKELSAVFPIVVDSRAKPFGWSWPRDASSIVYMALMHDRQLRLHYRKRDADAPTVHAAVHPLAVVQQAEALFEPAHQEPGFDVDAYIASGLFAVIAGAPVTLRVVFTRGAG